MITTPRGTTRRWVLATFIVPWVLPPLHAQQPPRFAERVEVARILLDARVLDRAGLPVLGLSADDFTVDIGGNLAPVESVSWVSGHAGTAEDAITHSADSWSGPLPQGRLVVFFIQKDMERGRIRGLVRLLVELRKFLDTFTPDDRVAVLSFDTYLKVWSDFTNDFDHVRALLKDGVLFQGPGPVQSGPSPSLLAHLDLSRARRTYSVESALRLVGEALKPLPGSKAIVLVGHGFGFLTRDGVLMVNRYDDTSKMLQAARASVFSLDITDADFHALEVGLQNVSDETGGFFARTNVFTARPLRRLEGALAGHYVLFVERPNLSPGEHRVRVRLTRAKGTVLARTTFVG